MKKAAGLRIRGFVMIRWAGDPNRSWSFVPRKSSAYAPASLGAAMDAIGGCMVCDLHTLVYYHYGW